ncbi:MAG: tRNA dihydrouridine(20/20a) synthase DusA [Gammaproteobacteria bacterium]|nr:MAG: tRNA dihydrouridine(20/20a) synthase DusA [Gammaproteobacteria bacterium]
MAMAAGKQVSVAPMMDVTDRHCRYFLRQISPHVRLYTEMITAQAVLHGDRERLLGFDPAEHPLALQLGGHDPLQLAAAARIAAARGYDEINLNVGCPSDRVRDGRFGACLMLEAEQVAHCVGAMAEAVAVPVTVKTRIGVDDHDSYEFLAAFVDRVARAGCGTFIVHARKAILQGLSPRENREVPPLQPERVHRLKREFPALRIIINGGIDSIERIDAELALLDGVMLGRKVAGDPCFLAAVEARFLAGTDERPALDRGHVVRRMSEYAQRQADSGVRLHHVTRHMLGLYHGQPGARGWRRFLCEQAGRPGARPQLLLDSLAAIGGRNGA